MHCLKVGTKQNTNMRNLLLLTAFILSSCASEIGIGRIQNLLEEPVILKVYSSENGLVLEKSVTLLAQESLNFAEVKTGSERSDFNPVSSLYAYLDLRVKDSISLVFNDQRQVTFVDDGNNRPQNIFDFTPWPAGAWLYEHLEKHEILVTFIIREDHKNLSR
jgi:hypothetical protein